MMDYDTIEKMTFDEIYNKIYDHLCSLGVIGLIDNDVTYGEVSYKRDHRVAKLIYDVYKIPECDMTDVIITEKLSDDTEQVFKCSIINNAKSVVCASYTSGDVYISTVTEEDKDFVTKLLLIILDTAVYDHARFS